MLILGLLVYLGVVNFSDYFGRYLAVYPFAETTGQAFFVRQMSEKAATDKRLTPRFVDVGVPFIYWGHGVNRFLNYGTPGSDTVNPADDLPVISRDVIFMIWPDEMHYLPVIKSYYPEGEVGNFSFSSDGKSNHLFTYYKIKAEQLDAQRFSVATYTPESGVAVQRQESTFGSTAPPPDNLAYPMQADWKGDLVAPAFAEYSFRLTAPGEANLVIDGMSVVSTTGGPDPVESSIILARGPHEVNLTANMAKSDDSIALGWSAGGTPYTAVARNYMWFGPGRGLLAEVRPFANDPFGDPPPDLPNVGTQPPVIFRRLDGFLGFQAASGALADGNRVVTDWAGDLDIAQTGTYTFEVKSYGGSVLLIDGNLVVDNRDLAEEPTTHTGQVVLDSGTHRFELRYNWDKGLSYLEVFWTTPGGEREILGPDVLHAGGGAWLPGSITAPPGFQLSGDTPEARVDLSPDETLGGPDVLSQPRGVAVDSDGNVYVGDRGHHRIVVFSPDGKVLHTWGKAPPKEPAGKPPALGEFSEIADVAVSGDSVYVLDNKGTLQVFGRDGQPKMAFDAVGLGLYSPNGIWASQDGYVYVADTGGSRLLKVSYGDNPTVQIFDGIMGADASSQVSNKLEQPLDVVTSAGDNGGRIYAIDLKNRIVQFAQDGRRVKQWQVSIGGIDGGSRMAINSNGSLLFVSNTERSNFAVLDLAKGTVQYLGSDGDGPGQFREPSGIAVGPAGQLYVVDSVKNDVQVFTLK